MVTHEENAKEQFQANSTQKMNDPLQIFMKL